MDKLSIGEFLSILRKGKGLKQEDVAEELGVSAKTISSWENNRTYPDIVMLPIIADYFGVTVDELVRGKKSNTTNDIEPTINSKNISKIKKIKYAKYKNKNLLFTFIGLLSSLICCVGLVLSCLVELWTLVFAILGFLGTGVFVLLLVVNRQNYLQNEGIFIGDDYTEHNNQIILSTIMSIVRSCLIITLPYIIYGFTILLIYIIDYSAFTSQVFTYTVDRTTTTLVWAIISLIVGILAYIICYIIYVKSNKKYANEVIKISFKRNIKLSKILSIILASILVFSTGFIYLLDLFGSIKEVYKDYCVYDTKEEFIQALKTYRVNTSDLEKYGINYGDEFVLSFSESDYEDLDNNVNNRFYELQNNFKFFHGNYTTQRHVVELYYREDIDCEDYKYDVQWNLLLAYSNSTTKTDITLNPKYTSIILNIPNNIFNKVYDSTLGIYYIDFNVGTYDVGNDYIIKVTNELFEKSLSSGLYYINNENDAFDEWIKCYYDWSAPRYYYIAYYNSKTNSFEPSKKTTIYSVGNTIDEYNYNYYYKSDCFFNILKSDYELCGNIINGMNKGKYGFYKYYSYYLSEALGPILLLIFSISLITELTIGIILWKKEKYIINFNC